MKADTIQSVNTKSDSTLNLSWRDQRYHRFYEVVDNLVQELQEHVWIKTGKPKRRLKGDGLEKLHYSVECLVRDCMAVVLQRKRKGEAAIRKGKYNYSAERSNKMLTYGIHIERAFAGLLELGYIEITKPGYFDRNGRKDGTPTHWCDIKREISAAPKYRLLQTISNKRILRLLVINSGALTAMF